MKGSMAHKATTSAEEKVSIIIGQMGKGVEGEAIHSYRYGGREC
jgi:hypothetical protein